MHREEFITYLVKKNARAPGGRTKVFYRESSQEIFAGIQDLLAQGKDITFLGFGTFSPKMRKARKGFNLKSMKLVKVPAMQVATFRTQDRDTRKIGHRSIRHTDFLVTA